MYLCTALLRSTLTPPPVGIDRAEKFRSGASDHRARGRAQPDAQVAIAPGGEREFAALADTTTSEVHEGYLSVVGQQLTSLLSVQLVLGSIDADFCNQIIIFQHFSRSTRFAHFCTARNSIYGEN